MGEEPLGEVKVLTEFFETTGIVAGSISEV